MIEELSAGAAANGVEANIITAISGNFIRTLLVGLDRKFVSANL